MENLVDSSLLGQSEIGLNQTTLAHINETRKWTLFLSILGMIFLGLLFFGMFAMNILMSTFMGMSGMSESPGMAAAPGIFMVILFLIIIIIYFFPIFFLLKFSTLSKRAIAAKDSSILESAMRYLKLHFRYIGILMIILIAFYALAGIIALLKS